MTNISVYKKKLKLPEKYLSDPKVSLMLRKPGTLSKEEKEWLRSYVYFMELRDFTVPAPSRTKLSDAFVRSLKK